MDSFQIWKLQKLIFSMLYWKKEVRNAFETHEKFGMKDVTAVFDAYPNDGDMAKKPNNILFDWAER